MTSARALLEALHGSGRGMPLWMAFQAMAMLAALAWLALRTRGADARLRLCLVLSFGGALAGASLFGVLVRLPVWLASGGALSHLAGGVVAYGALAGLVVSFAALARLRGIPAGEALDRLAPCLGALVVLGRLGCFFAGCDFGTVSGAPWAVRFPAGSPAFAEHVARGLVVASDHRSLPVHPTQLYEVLVGLSASLCTMAFQLKHRQPKEKPTRITGVAIPRAIALQRGHRQPHITLLPARPGAAFWVFAAVYAAGRLFVERLRGDSASVLWGPLTASAWMSLMVLVAAAVWAISPRVRERPSAPPSRALSRPAP